MPTSTSCACGLWGHSPRCAIVKAGYREKLLAQFNRGFEEEQNYHHDIIPEYGSLDNFLGIAGLEACPHNCKSGLAILEPPIIEPYDEQEHRTEMKRDEDSWRCRWI